MHCKDSKDIFSTVIIFNQQIFTKFRSNYVPKINVLKIVKRKEYFFSTSLYI